MASISIVPSGRMPHLVIPANAGFVIPANAGIHFHFLTWAPAFAGVTGFKMRVAEFICRAFSPFA
jgi:hypothetical protein